MRIRVIQSGGLPGLRREFAVDSSRLRTEDAGELARLVKAAGFFSLPVHRLSRLPDVLQYEVHVEDDGGRGREIKFDDQTGEPFLLELVDRVKVLARS